MVMKPLKPLRPLPKVVRKKAPALAGSRTVSHSYNPETGHLDVTFHGGRKYRYHGVSQETADDLASAPSTGSFLHSSIIGKHRHEKMD